MQKLFSMFPAGAPGMGLLFLRLAMGLQMLVYSGCCEASRMPVWLATVILVWTGLICLAVVTPVLAVLWILFACVLVFMGNLALIPAATSILSALALALLGPGAYSVDARLFGRRVIVLPDGLYSE
ncbi:hypothetical protein ACO0K9_27255 [Undibacterium sp. Ji50W]|uniref:hypothetical protein n=1 Tax=Undibacterium sp. Ji50W TaxID=3413041 RepID=UPI003BF36A44